MAKDINLFMGTQQEPQEIVGIPRVSPIMLTLGSVHQPHIENGAAIIKFGLSADRPISGTQYPAFFARDTGVLSLWNGEAWLTTTLT